MLGTIYSGHTQVYDSTSRTFEELNAEIFKEQGYVVLLTRPTTDRGVDIKLRMMLPYLDPIETVLQTKLKGQGEKIQRTDVQQLQDATLGVDRAIFVSSGDFSKDPIEYAKE